MKNFKNKVSGILVAVFMLGVSQMAQPMQVKASTLTDLNSKPVIIIVDGNDPPES